jgi:hypothetical protein
VKNELEEIRNHAQLFRSAIESCKNKLSIPFKDFPSGSCGATTDILGVYLCEKGYGKFNYICASENKIYASSHAWLEKDRLIVDITADQFEDQNNKVIVTAQSSWHENKFINKEVRPVRNLDMGDLQCDYKTIKENIKSS